MPPPMDLKGLVFGRWTVLEFIGRRKGQSMWKCRCQCGRGATVSLGNLRSGRSTQCMLCASQHHRQHGMSNTYVHRVWAMIRGNRCKAWDSFAVFLRDMGPPGESPRLQRIDMSKPHGPRNSLWRPREIEPALLAALTAAMGPIARRDAVNAIYASGYKSPAICRALGVSRERVRQIRRYKEPENRQLTITQTNT